MTENPTDEVLVARVKQGDKQAFDALVKKYRHKIVAIACRYGVDQSETLDVAQDVFIKAYRALPLFRGGSSFYTWLYRIGINVARYYQLSRKRRPPASDIDINDAEMAEIGQRLRDLDNPEARLLAEEIYRVVRLALDEMSDELSTALTLREFDGLSYEDIAQIMQCPVGTVRSRIFRARETLDAKLKPLLQE
jgi:RNA polymerase sigma-70 factor (ECF subfamily)